MNKCTLVAALTASALAMPATAQAQQAKSGLQGSFTADMYWGSTKIRETRKEDDDIPSFSASIEHDVPYLPNFRLRYTKLDTPDLAHDKYDYTFYYRPLRTDALEFDVGFTLSDYRNSFYRYEPGQEGDFDSVIFSWYADTLIRVPNTNFAIVGEFDYGETDEIKSADVTGAIQYTFSFQPVDVSIRGGYRVLDYTFKEYDKKAYGFVDGWFAGVKFEF
ncbi:ABC-type Fe3+-hydroxamate transport system [Vibrio sp. JCM 19236]|nr:ABC-type Fe3+-hydroxamate transport system [Vibrio sp. JCM 19236]